MALRLAQRQGDRINENDTTENVKDETMGHAEYAAVRHVQGVIMEHRQGATILMYRTQQ